jgi:hypothetical protein
MEPDQPSVLDFWVYGGCLSEVGKNAIEKRRRYCSIEMGESSSTVKGGDQLITSQLGWPKCLLPR